MEQLVTLGVASMQCPAMIANAMSAWRCGFPRLSSLTASYQDCAHAEQGVFHSLGSRCLIRSIQPDAALETIRYLPRLGHGRSMRLSRGRHMDSERL